jgi:hypothetical protein
MAWLALGALALLGVLALARVFVAANPQTVKLILAWTAAILGAGALALLLAVGRGGQALWGLMLAAPLLWRWWQARRFAMRFASGAAGQGGAAAAGQGGDVSAVETAMLTMELHHATGRMTGRVRRGRFAGADLSDLGLPRLLELLGECAAEDPDSVPLLEAWLDRAWPDWREQAAAGASSGGGGGGRGPGGVMGRAEALAVLGLPEEATRDEILAAHRRLMRAAHPDQGGSAWIAARVNQARDVLLKE